MKLRLLAILAVAILAATATVALAAHPEKSRIYFGRTSHESDEVIVKVSSSGKTVTAYVPRLPLYCQGGGPSPTQVNTPAKISASGAFTAKISYVFEGKTSYRALVKGTFVKKTLVKGTVRSEYATKECSGTTSFTAKPSAAL
jgi:hypothetical protein